MTSLREMLMGDLLDREADRFLPKVRFAARGCWVWTGATAGKGYGRFRLRGRKVYVHRLVLEAKIGRLLAPGEQALHHCDHPLCVNPDHLFVGTQQDNMDDMTAKGRQVTPRGEANGCSKLTQSQVDSIREALRSNPDASYSELGRRYGVGSHAISRIARGLLWRDEGWTPMDKRF